MKRKTITLVIYMLVCMSLVSVGFAAWIITGGDKAETTGNVTASPVVDESLVISEKKWLNEPNNVTGTGSITFGRPTTVTNDSWLQADEGDAVEKLTATYQFTLALSDQTQNSSIGAAVGKLESNKISIDYSPASGIATAIESNYIVNGYDDADNTKDRTVVQFSLDGGKTFVNYTQSAFEEALEALTTVKTVNIQIKIEYSWGSEFDGKNPYNFYNCVEAPTGNETMPDSNETYKAHAKEHLGALYTAINTNNTFNLVIRIGIAAAQNG